MIATWGIRDVFIPYDTESRPVGRASLGSVYNLRWPEITRDRFRLNQQAGLFVLWIDYTSPTTLNERRPHVMLPERATIPSMIDFQAIIRHLWANAIKDMTWDHTRYDVKALDALSKEDDPNRRNTIRDWLQTYRVFRVRGIATQRDKIADAVLRWADSRDRDRDLAGPDALYAAHKELMKPVCEPTSTVPKTTRESSRL